MKVMNMQLVLGGMKPQIIRRPDGLATFDTTSRNPHRKSSRIVITTISLFTLRSPAKFPSPNYQCFIQ